MQNRLKQNLAILSPTLRWFLVGMILANIGSSMLFSLLSLYNAELGADITQIGLVFSAASTVPLVLKIFSGIFQHVDRIFSFQAARRQGKFTSAWRVCTRTPVMRCNKTYEVGLLST